MSLDLLILALMGAGALRGWFAGATRQFVSAVGWIVGFLVARALMAPAGIVLSGLFGLSERTAPLAGFVVLFTLALIGVALLGHAIRKTLEAVRLGSIDKALGSGIGALKAALGLSVFLLVTGFSPLPGGEPWLISREAREASQLHDPVRGVAPALWRFVRGAVDQDGGLAGGAAGDGEPVDAATE